jgi:hypothetical protein
MQLLAKLMTLSRFGSYEIITCEATPMKKIQWVVLCRLSRIDTVTIVVHIKRFFACAALSCAGSYFKSLNPLVL